MPIRSARLSPLLALVLSAGAAAATPADGLLLPPTPLVLKDGRIASVTVHTVPFPLGKDEPDEPARAALATLVEEVATDCFLTAQAVGHVEPGPGSDGETLAAHRLARARADRVQAALTGRGLPAASIASVWDWQFAVREPRVTLWVFRLAEGDDCESRPIARQDAAPAVETPIPTPVSEPAPPADPAPVPPVAPPAAEMVVEATPDAAAEAAALALAAPEPATEPQPVPADPIPPPAEVIAAIAPQPEPEPPAPAPTPETAAAAIPPPEAATHEAVAAEVAAPEVAVEPSLAIGFDVNSSYFPKGTNRELEAMVRGLVPRQGYEFLLEASVSAEALRNRPPEEGQAYNRWIADRRLERVAGWLRQKLGNGVSIRQAYVENDNSRRVTVTARPMS